MKIAHHDTDDHVVIIAEIGNNHEGSIVTAEELIGRAAEVGVDAVKFQTIVPERLVAVTETARRAQLARLCLPHDAFVHLARVAADAGVVFLSTPFDCESSTFLAPLVPVFKIASGDITFLPHLAHVACVGKPIIISTGAATIEEITAAVACVRRTWLEHGIEGSIALLHCVAGYPAPPEQANLAVIMTLQQRFPDCTIGYSDHVIGNEAAVAAVALGARIIEKHFTISHNYSDFQDHQLSATPDELRALVTRIRAVEQMLGSGEKVPQHCEESGRINIRRSIAVARDLPAGHTLVSEDLTWVRPGGGIPPGRESEVVGRVLRRAVSAGMLIDPAFVAQPVASHEVA